MKILLIVVAALLCGAPALAAAPAEEQKFLEMMGLDTYEQVSYLDDSGANIGFDKFKEGIKGKSYTMMRDDATSTLVFQIKDNLTARKLTTSRLTVAENPQVKRGEQLPEASLRDLEGRVVGLHSRGSRPLLVNFFFAACAPCIAETPALNAFAKRRKDVEVVAVTFDDPATARKFATRHGFEWPIVPDGQGFLDKAGIKSFPSFAYVGKDGKVLGIATGSEIARKANLTAEELDAWIGKLEAR